MNDVKRSCPWALGPMVLLVLFGLLPGATEAQVTTGTIVGTVHDQQGRAVPGATVTITRGEQGTVAPTRPTPPARTRRRS